MQPSFNSPGRMDESCKLVTRLPTCEYCLDRSEYYGDTARGARKSYMCEHHFRQLGQGLGNGRGYRLVIAPESSRR